MIRFNNHAFKELDVLLKRLFDLLGSMNESAQQLADLLPGTLEKQTPAAFEQAKLIDKTINHTELATDQLVAEIIGKFTINGEDLRFILAAVKVAATLERAADKIKNCIKRLGKITHPLDAILLKELQLAITSLKAMLAASLPQLVDYQADVVKEILQHGGQVQRSYRAVLLRLHETDAGLHSNDATHLLLVAKNLEQAADMAVEIIKIGHYVNFGTKYEKNSAA